MIGDNLHDIRIVDLIRHLDPLLERPHRQFGVAQQREDQRVDSRRIDERFIALDVDDVLGIVGRGDLGDAIGSGRVIGPRHADDRFEAARLVGIRSSSVAMMTLDR